MNVVANLICEPEILKWIYRFKYVSQYGLFIMGLS